MTTAAAVLVTGAMAAALCVAVWPRRAPTLLARAALTVLVGVSAAITLAAVTAAALR